MQRTDPRRDAFAGLNRESAMLDVDVRSDGLPVPWGSRQQPTGLYAHWYCTVLTWPPDTPWDSQSYDIQTLFRLKPNNFTDHRLSPHPIRRQQGPANNVGGHEKPFRHSRW